MKRRLSCLLIALVMLMALLPAVSLVASADEAPAGPAVGTYEYYAQKGMWYGTGDGWTTDPAAVEPGTTELTPLMSFVDLTHADAETTWQAELNGYNSFPFAAAATIRVFYPWNSSNFHFNDFNADDNGAALHGYIKITDGQLAGMFYPISPIRARSGVAKDKVLSIDSYGNILYYQQTTHNDSLVPGVVGNSALTMFVAKSFSADSKNTDAYEVDDHWKIAADGTAIYGAEAKDYSYFIDDYMSIKADTEYSIEHVTKIKNKIMGDGTEQKNLGDNPWNNVHYTSLNLFNEGFAGREVKSSWISLQYASGSVLTGVSFNGTVTPITGATSLGENSTSATSCITVKRDSTDGATANVGYKVILPEAGLVTDSQTGITMNTEDIIGMMPKASIASQTIFVRTYNKALTDEQVKQNHLADLMYYYNIDLGDSTAEDFVSIYDSAMSLNVGLTPDVDGAAFTATVATLNAFKTCATTGHVAGADDGDCTTDIPCAVCEQAAVVGADNHVAKADDGDCTTDILCDNVGCTQVAVEGENSHIGPSQTDCTIAVPAQEITAIRMYTRRRSMTPTLMTETAPRIFSVQYVIR